MLLVYFILAFISLECLFHVFLTPIVCSYYNVIENKNIEPIASRLVKIILFHIHVYLAMKYRGNVDEDRVFGKSSISTTFANYCIAYFIWDLKNIYYYINNNNSHKILMFIHHVYGSFILYYTLLSYGVGEYYVLYYFGISEISSIPLCIMDFYKDYKFNKRKEYIIIQVLFVVLFLLIRTVGFAYLFFPWHVDVFKISPEFYIPLLPGQYYFMGLTIYWTYKIYKGLKKLIKSN